MAEKYDGNDDAKNCAHPNLLIPSSPNDMFLLQRVSAERRLAYEDPSKCYCVVAIHSSHEANETLRQVLVVILHSGNYISLFMSRFDIPVCIGNLL